MEWIVIACTLLIIVCLGGARRLLTILAVVFAIAMVITFMPKSTTAPQVAEVKQTMKDWCSECLP